jgi:hypothetical protein
MAAFARREGNRSIDIKISDGRKNVSAGSCYGCWMHDAYWQDRAVCLK